MPPEDWSAVAPIVFTAVGGAFGTAWVHEQTGRDVTLGGVLGLLIGATTGVYGLATLWVSLLAQPTWLRGRLLNRTKRWYTWWRWW